MIEVGKGVQKAMLFVIWDGLGSALAVAVAILGLHLISGLGFLLSMCVCDYFILLLALLSLVRVPTDEEWLAQGAPQQ